MRHGFHGRTRKKESFKLRIEDKKKRIGTWMTIDKIELRDEGIKGRLPFASTLMGGVMKKIVGMLITILFFSSCGKSIVDENKFVFGTMVGVKIVGDREKTKIVFDELERIDREINSRNSSGSLYKLNRDRKLDSVDEESIELIKSGVELGNLSSGRFDITILPLMKVWGFEGEARESVPSGEEIEKALLGVNYKNIKIGENSVELFGDVEVDLGAYIKGYAISRAAMKLRESGVESGMISAISSIELIGKKINGRPWRIGIENPKDRGELLGIVEGSDIGIGVSGDYQTFVEIDGKKYHHIMDATKGYPVFDKKMVVVVAKDSYIADMYSTLFFVMDIDEIMEMVEKIGGVEVLVVDDKMEKSFSSGMNRYFKEKR